MNLQYRADIDGLRAIAVLAVLFFHTEVPGFSGGFVGVDIFFVISGFLITSIILKEINANTLSIANFYERRIRRIFPALFPVILFSLVVGAYLFDSMAFEDLGQSITATSLFSSNILFWRESGYFAAPSLQKPLLHTWSLAVEEQFYIFFPLAMLAIHRFLKRKYFAWVIVAFILSLAASVYGVYKHPEATFYLVPTRAWELMVGSILALGVLPAPSSPAIRNSLSMAGISLIIYSIIYYTEATPFPGYNALAPVIGSGLIIYSVRGGGTSLITKLLSVRPLVFIGLISYSLYLWHWPLIAFSKYLMFRDFTWIDSSLIILASFVFAIASWKFIEQPFRGKTPIFTERKQLFVTASVVMVAASGIGGVIHLQNGMAWRYPEANIVMKAGEWEWYPNNIYGNLEQVANHIFPGKCGDESVEPSFLLWGDSHAMSMVPAFDITAKRYGLSGFITTRSSCPPIIGLVEKPNKVYPFNYETFNQNVLTFIEKNPEIKTVFLGAAWSSYIGDENETFQKDSVEQGLYETVEALEKMNRRVVLIGDFPWISNYDGPRVLYLDRRFPDLYDLDTLIVRPSKAEYDKQNASVNLLFEKIAKESNAFVVRQDRRFFESNSRVPLVFDREPLYRNGSHLSTFGSLFVASAFDDIFGRIAEDARKK